MSPYLKALLELVESRKWISPTVWETIVQNAHKETLQYLRNEALPQWKLFNRVDWMDPAVKARLSDMVVSRLASLKDSALLQKLFDGIDLIF